jgi:hypothetical protein
MDQLEDKDPMTLFLESQTRADNQGTADWLKETRNSVGGSSISSFTGHGYGGLEDFIINRVFKRDFNNLAMDFGSMMEEVLPRYLSLKLGVPIHFLGAVPYIQENKRLLAHYSMDGMYKANMHSLCPIFEDAERVNLLEIKFPWSRELKKYKTNRSGTKGSCIIPSSYIDQVKMGLIVISPCEVGVFADCFARMCTLDQLDPIKWNEYSPVHAAPRNEITQVLASGIIKVFFKTDKYHEDIGYKGVPIDFGGDFPKIIGLVKQDKKVDPDLSVEYFVSLGCQSVDMPEDENLLGVIPFKLFDVYFGRVDKDEHFLDEIIEKVKKVSNLLYDIEDLPEEEKADALDGLVI